MKLSTFLVVVGMFIISLYALVEVNYYSAAQEAYEHPGDIPYLEIPKIGVDQSINNESVDYGIYHDPRSAKPGNGTTALFGHRTLHGSPFLKLDQLQKGDNITIEWPGIGTVEYQVENITVVPADYQLSIEQGNVLFLITCYPLGSTKERLMIEALPVNTYPIQKVRKANPQQNYALILIVAFLVVGSLISFLYPIKGDRIIIFMATVVLTLFLVFGYFYPVPADGIEANLSRISDFLGV
jgi:sortase A